MNKEAATTIALEMGGEPRQISNGNWQVIIYRADGMLVVISDVAVWEYKNEQDFQDGQVHKTTPLGKLNRVW